jgi:hypothetical protein
LVECLVEYFCFCLFEMLCYCFLLS